MQTDPVEEWRRLTEHYRTLTDDQLNELAIDLADLTEVAQQILRSEMKSRGLRDPQAPLAAQTEVQRVLAPESDDSLDLEQSRDTPHEYTWKTLLRECNSREEAWQLAEMLRRAGIESWLDGPGFYSPHAELDLTNPRILVAADELDQARIIIAQPIPQSIVDESRMRMPEFELPTCPACGTADPLLESVDPVNLWRCETCGRQWTDPGERPEETSQTARG
ncbi:MAG TPA: hypothetical protein VFB43_04990 [Terracidiphilus sp.]|nr:hypothetical protein [Terracidiphilus sp.]